MKKFVLFLYKILPQEVVFKIAGIRWLKPIRDSYLRESDGKPKLTVVDIDRTFGEVQVKFKFKAPYKVASKAAKYGVESAALRNSIIKILTLKPEQNAIVFDVGTNYGYLSTVWALSLCRNGGKVFSFEPVPFIANVFRQSVVLNNLSNTIVLTEKAVGKNAGYLDLAKNESEISKVEVISIDDFVKSNDVKGCDLIKIDTDGDDYGVLMGAQETIKKFRPTVVIETNHKQEIVDYLLEIDYQIYDVQLVPMADWKELPKNLLCFPNNR